MSGNFTSASFTSNSSNETSAASTTAAIRGMSSKEKAILMPFYFISLLVALIGNVLIILVFYKYKPIRKFINYFVLNMAISDLFTPLTIMPYIIAKTLSDGAFLKQIPSPLAGVVCKLCYILADTSIVVSVMSLLMISLDRLIAVVFPLQIRFISKKVRFICISMSWVVAISVFAFYFRCMIYFQGHCYLNWDAESISDYRVAISIAFFFIPVCLLTIIYGAIAVILKRRQRKRKSMSISKGSHDNSSNRHIIGLSVAILAGFIISIGPVIVHFFIVIILKREAFLIFEYPALEFIINKLLLHSWGAFNPCICFAFSENYRTGLKCVFMGGSRSGRLSLSANKKLTSSRKRTRSSNSNHLNTKAVRGNGNEWFKLAGEEKYRSQEQEKGNGKQEQKV